MRNRLRKMSLGNEDEVEAEDQESSCSGHESQSASSGAEDDAGSCSQSDISLCDDGGSDGEAAEGDDFGNLFFDGEHQTDQD